MQMARFIFNTHKEKHAFNAYFKAHHAAMTRQALSQQLLSLCAPYICPKKQNHFVSKDARTHATARHTP
jgi:hypothetical protein